ncbi:DNA-dependent protein kinase catalytic subunit, partial [Lethenteron reissneri]|uniref:DNA-dependent protein kinase catalytic subunit n=1 Tax=Lethenteron reissneri TaxID=7753 RepID=UPI002AB6698A
FYGVLVSNLSLTRYKEVYAASAEVLGLALEQLSQSDPEGEKGLADLATVRLESLQRSDPAKFVGCLELITRSHPPFADRFVAAVLSLVPRLHGALKTQCLRVVATRASTIASFYTELQAVGFLKILASRDDECQAVCLGLLEEALPGLGPAEVAGVLEAVGPLGSHPADACRLRLYLVLMRVYDTY